MSSLSSNPTRVRFAPSPTGRLHLGNARTAVVNWLTARHAGGAFVLRIDDTDRERSQPALVAAIAQDLRWLGLDWDERAVQSERDELYAARFAELRARGQVYPAYETAEELEAMRRRLRARKLPPRYDRGALRLDEAARARLEAEGRVPHWRLRLSDETVTFVDRVRGPQAIDLKHLSDPVLRRADGSFTYTFASVIDDLELAISHVIRGEDHLTNTAVQIDLMRALGGELPAFGHLPLILDAEGGKVSKRLGAASLDDLRAAGIEALAIDQTLAALGTGKAPQPEADLGLLVRQFDLAAFGTAQPRLALADLERQSAAVLRHLPFAAVHNRLAADGLGELDEPFWLALRGNLDRYDDIRIWWQVCRAPLAPIIEDAEYLRQAADFLIEASDGGAWLEMLKQRTGRKGKSLFHPLRLALTARERGPDLPSLLAQIGKPRAVARLRGQTA